MTFGWLASTPSTRSGEIFSPPRLMSSLMRPRMLRSPAADRDPRSPVRNQPSVKFAAVIVGSPRYPRTTVVPRSQISPTAPAGSGSPSDPTIRICAPVDRPTRPVDTTGVSVWSIPSICVVVTWWVASVMPKAHTTGAANSVCSASAAWAVSGALQLRMKRSAAGLRPDGSVADRSNRIW
ncbi:Uncharacterised protein [Mycobacterium tuberculosis]|uniref:Uncharacterized protein n=1 Tax=Mycobacterium tuberculosis TaxID=1773 RepID=A0A655JGA6_MYCTX|nr:Uncharacterised protein [Mycobacterium tuberculosis]